MSKPTVGQMEALKNLGIRIPPTKASCSSLIRWIKNGGEHFGSERIAIIKNTQNQYIRKRVRHHYTKKDGLVLYILQRPLGSKVGMCKSISHPLDARVEYDDGTIRTTGVGYLELIEE